MRLLEKILAVGFLISLGLKFALIPGGDYIALWMLSILSCIYYPLGFLFFNQIKLRHILKKDSYKDVSVLKIIIAIVTGSGLSIICIGSLFKLLNLTGGDEVLLIGVFVTLLVLIICLIKFLKNRDSYYQFIFKRITVVGSMGMILLFTPDIVIIKLQFRNYPDYIQAYENHLNDPTNKELWKKRELEYYRIMLNEDEFKRYEASTTDQ